MAAGPTIKRLNDVAKTERHEPRTLAGTMLMGLLGGRVWPTDLEGVRYPHALATYRVYTCASGQGCHWEQCGVLVKNQRHSAMQRALGDVLGKKGSVEFEVSPGPDGRGSVPRLYFGAGRGTKAPGDVRVVLREGGAWWLDTTVVSSAGVDALRRAASPAEAAYDKKMRAWVQRFGSYGLRFLPVAMSTTGCMDRRSYRTLKSIVGVSDMAVVIAAPMIAQALFTLSLVKLARQAGGVVALPGGAVAQAGVAGVGEGTTAIARVRNGAM